LIILYLREKNISMYELPSSHNAPASINHLSDQNKHSQDQYLWNWG